MFKILIAVLISFSFYSSAFCAAWIKVKDGKQVLTAMSSFSSDEFFDSNGNSVNSNIKFRKKELNIYAEKGVTDSITIGSNITIQQQTFIKENINDPVYDFRQCGVLSSNNQKEIDINIAESEVFLRKEIYKTDNLVFSLQPLIKLPCLLFDSSGFAVINDTMDFEIRALIGYNFKTNFFDDIQNNFINSELSLRKRDNQFADQIKFDNTIGLNIDDKNMIMAQSFSIFSIGKEPISGVIGNNGLFTVKDNYYSVKLQGSYVRNIDENKALQFSYFDDVMGKNSGNGSGFLISLWREF